MLEPEQKRVRRTPQEIANAVEDQINKLNGSISEIEEKKRAAVADFDKKIEAIHAKIKHLEEKKKALLAPKPAPKPRKTKKQKIEALMKQAQKAGMTPEEIASKLGLEAGK